MALELYVYASLVKDVVYSVAMLILFYILKFPTYWLFLLHAITWVAGLLYYSSTDSDFYFSTLALVVNIFVVCVDALVVLNTTCYLSGVNCCLPDSNVSPFTLTFKVCGPNDRNQNDSLIWIALATVGLGLITGIAREANMYSTRRSSSIEVMLVSLYTGLKVYMLSWNDVSYSGFFVFQTVLTIAASAAGIIVSSFPRLRVVAVILFAGVLLVDLLVVLGATHSINFFQNSYEEIKHAANSGVGARHLLEDVGSPPDSLVRAALANAPSLNMPSAREALTGAVATLAALSNEATTDAAAAALGSAVEMLQSFSLGVTKACESAHAEVPNFSCATAQADAAGALAVAEMTPCCDRNTNYMAMLRSVQTKLENLDARFNNVWATEAAAFDEHTVEKVKSDVRVQQQADLLKNLPKNESDWTQLSKNVLAWIKNIWHQLVAKNVQQTQTPWITKSGLPVPNVIKIVWITLHGIFCFLGLFTLIGVFTRDPNLPMFFGAAPMGMKKDDTFGAPLREVADMDASAVALPMYGGQKARHRQRQSADVIM